MSNEELFEKMRIYGITPYNLRILQLYAKGGSEKTVASDLGTSITAVNMVKSRLKKRMGCESTLQMFIKLVKEGII